MTKKVLDIPVIIEKDDEGFYAFCPTLQGCYAQGETYEEILKNLSDIIKLNIEDCVEEGEELKTPENISLTSIKVEVGA